jgi:hypothetical protein
MDLGCGLLSPASRCCIIGLRWSAKRLAGVNSSHVKITQYEWDNEFTRAQVAYRREGYSASAAFSGSAIYRLQVCGLPLPPSPGHLPTHTWCSAICIVRSAHRDRCHVTSSGVCNPAQPHVQASNYIFLVHPLPASLAIFLRFILLTN